MLLLDAFAEREAHESGDPYRRARFLRRRVDDLGDAAFAVDHIDLLQQDDVLVELADASFDHLVENRLGKIGVLVALESTGKTDVLAPLARLIALHVAAASPLAVDSTGIDPEVVAREKKVLAEKNAGKPPHVLEKIVESGLKTYYKEVTLLEQPSIHAEHSNKTIGQVLKEAEGAAGAPVTLKAFVRYALGEGIEKQESDFAAEVAAASGQG